MSGMAGRVGGLPIRHPPPIVPALPPTRRQRWRRIDARLSAGLGWVAAVALLVLALAVLGLRAWVWPRIDQWREPIARSLSERLGVDLRMARLLPGTDSWLPDLVVEGLELREAGEPVLAVPRLRLRLAASMLWTLEPRLELLELHEPRLRVERIGPRQLRVAGIDLDLGQPDDGRFLERLFGQRRLRVHAARIDWVDRVDAQHRSVGPIEASFGSVGRQHRVELQVPAVGGA